MRPRYAVEPEPAHPRAMWTWAGHVATIVAVAVCVAIVAVNTYGMPRLEWPVRAQMQEMAAQLRASE